MMEAFRLEEVATAEREKQLVLIRCKLPIPTQLEEDEVLVQVEAIGVCYRDLLEKQGGFYSISSLPIIPGHEVDRHL